MDFNIARWSGFADVYDEHRPSPPSVYMDILTQMIQMAKPMLVVDTGCGTGLSTRVWADRAEQVIGIEPNPDMRGIAEARTQATNIRYQAGVSTNTGLPDNCADIVTISQALHWMQPEPTFRETARILRPNGIFAAIDCDWPPTIHPDIEIAYNEVMKKAGDIEKKHGYAAEIRYVSKDEHLKNMRVSGQFRYTKEIVLHSIETGDTERIVGLAVSQGHVSTPLKHGHSYEELGLDNLRAVAKRVMGEKAILWYFSYRVRIGVK